MSKRFPSEKDLKRLDKELNEGPATEMLHPNATDLEKLKFDICQAVVKYMIQSKLTQRQLAEELEVDESIVSNIVRHKVHHFTVDRLIGYLNLLGMTLRAKVAKIA